MTEDLDPRAVDLIGWSDSRLIVQGDDEPRIYCVCEMCGALVPIDWRLVHVGYHKERGDLMSRNQTFKIKAKTAQEAIERIAHICKGNADRCEIALRVQPKHTERYGELLGEVAAFRLLAQDLGNTEAVDE